MATNSALADDMSNAVPVAEPRPIFLRAYVPPPDAGEAKSHARRRYPRASEWVLVFDTETWPDAAQNLRIGTYQLRRRGHLRDKGLFYNPDEVTDDELATLQRTAPQHGCRLITVTEFREAVLFDAAYEADATIVGFNLPFDISRLALKHESARAVRRRDGSLDRSMAGGFTFKLSGRQRRPNIRVRHLSGRSAFINFAQPAEQASVFLGDDGEEQAVKRPGFFLDLRTLAAALTSNSFTLDKLADFLGVARKASFSDFGRAIDPEFITYAVQDTEVTWQCYEALIARYQQHGLGTPPTRIYSEAGLGKAYLNAMNIRPWRVVQPDFPPEIIGAMMSSYFGGRAEVHRRREIVPALYCDFASMYPSVCTLMCLWRYVVSDGVTHEDWTEGATAFLADVGLAQLQQQDAWSHLHALVQVRPDADIFPVRARYGEEPTSTIGLNYLSADRPLWMTLADCIASKLLTGKAPTVIRAIRFAAGETQADLERVNIAGNDAYGVDPSTENFYKRVIDLRREVKDALKLAKRRAAPSVEIDRLDAEQLALKILANATSYGIFIELNVEDADRDAPPVTAFGVGGEFTTSPRQRETPGSHFHPLLATLITGAARLMLAITERLPMDEGLDWAFCDTDSMAFTPPAGMAQAEFRLRVERIGAWFEALNPYEKAGSILEFEDQNSDPDTGQPRDLFCYAISAKRYALFNWSDDGRPIIRKASAHGLGHLLPPYGDDDPDAPPRASGVHLWQEHFWEELIIATQRADDDDDAGLAWRAELERPAASRYAATTPSVLGWFNTYNRSRPYETAVRPFNFLLWFHARKPHERVVEDEFGVFDPRERRPKPVAPYARDVGSVKERWDRETGEPVAPDWLRTYAEVLRTYPVHSESKFLDGVRSQRGPTRRRHIFADLVWNMGKEADRFEEDSSMGSDEDAAVPYAMTDVDRAACVEAIRSAKHEFGVRALRKAAAVSDHTINRALALTSAVPGRDLFRMRSGADRLKTTLSKQVSEDAALLAALREKNDAMGLKTLALLVKADPSNLAKVLSGSRRITKTLRNAAKRTLMG